MALKLHYVIVGKTAFHIKNRNFAIPHHKLFHTDT